MAQQHPVVEHRSFHHVSRRRIIAETAESAGSVGDGATFDEMRAVEIAGLRVRLRVRVRVCARACVRVGV